MPADAPTLECRDLRKSFSGVPVLRGVSLETRAGGILGVAGENGAGKSTLMNIVGGVLEADGGAMTIDGARYAPKTPLEAFARGIAFVHQELNLFTNLSIADNLFLTAFPLLRRFGIPAIDRVQLRHRAQVLLGEAGLDLDPGTPVERLSQGERQLVEIARALGAEARVLILDEPTTSLARADVERLFAIVRALAGRGMSVIYISHALDDMLRLCDDFIVLRDGEVAARGARAGFDKERLISVMVGRPISQLYPDKPERQPGEVALEAVAVSQPGLVHDIHLTVRSGEIVGISGLMGSGRTELARILFGLDSCASGDIRLRGKRVNQLGARQRIRLGMAFVTESRREDGLLLDQPVEPNLRLVASPRDPLDRLVESLRLRARSLTRQPVQQLSGGNQQKVALGKWLLGDPSVLILDEPTRGIDVGARSEVYSMIHDLASRHVAILVISSEIEELTGICDRILVMRKGEIRKEFAVSGFDREEILRASV
jgi:ribose transport system ATP-binding protein